MNEQTYEQEIDLRKMFYRVCRDWRKCLIIALAVAAIVGMGNLIVKGIRLTNPENLEREKKNYERELNAYKSEGETLQREIENLEDMQVQQEEYNEASILMQINPFSEFNASVQLYISTDYQIIPELTYQNIDISTRILQAYVTYMQNGDMHQYIKDHLMEQVELRYLQEVVFISIDSDSRMVTLNVQGVDERSCQEMLTYALEGIQAKKDEILQTVGDHELNIVNQSIFETVDLNLDSWQKSKRQYVLELNVNLKEKLDALTAWRLTPAPEKEYESAAIVKDSIKKMILCFIIVVVLVVGVLAVCYIVSDKVRDAKDLKNRFGLRVLAEIPKARKKRCFGWVDSMFAKMCGLVLKESEAELLTKVAAQSMSAELAAHMGDAAKKLVFTGSIREEEIKSLLSGMEWASGISVCSVASILCDPSAVTAVMDADYVVLVEKQEESCYSQIERELEKLAAWKKEVLGVIVLGVDGIPA